MTPVLIIIARCTVDTLMAKTFLFSSTHMVWTLPLEITPQSCSPYSPAITMVYWHGLFPERITFQSVINSTPRISGLSPSHPPRIYPFEGPRENHALPGRTSTSSHTARRSLKLKTFFCIILCIWRLNSPTYPALMAPYFPYHNHDSFYSTHHSSFYPFNRSCCVIATLKEMYCISQICAVNY